jgi:hypothetical protein
MYKGEYIVRIRLTLIALVALLGFPCFAQSNERVDALLAQQQTTVDIAAYIVLAAGGQVAEDAAPADAYALAQQNKWLPAGLGETDPLRLDAFCALVMRSLGLKGGLMYSIFPGPRYAYREFVAKGIVDGNGGPHRLLPGDEALTILRQAMELKGGAK